MATQGDRWPLTARLKPQCPAKTSRKMRLLPPCQQELRAERPKAAREVLGPEAEAGVHGRAEALPLQSEAAVLLVAGDAGECPPAATLLDF